MGQFSWIDCKDEGRAILDNVLADSYLLIPAKFGGGHYHETCYEGYGEFDFHDVYEEVAKWNRSHLTEDMISKPTLEGYGGNEYFYNLAVERYNVSVNRLKDYASRKKSDSAMRAAYGSEYLRDIGIDIACYDEQNFSLPYPIKITHDSTAVYEECEPSKSDPNQGWGED